MEEFYTVNQSATFLKVHPLTIRRYIREGKLKAVKIGGNVRVALNELRAFTQNFIAYQQAPKTKPIVSTKEFSYDDPLFSLKARGFSIDKLQEK